jgi:lipid A oxidase
MDHLRGRRGPAVHPATEQSKRDTIRHLRASFGVSPASRRRLRALAAAAGVVLAAWATPASAQWALDLRAGGTWIPESDLHVSAPGGTDLTLHDVAWDASSSSSAWFGVALTRWSSPTSRWGFGIDLSHALAVLDGDATVQAHGTEAGKPVDGPRIVGEVVPTYRLDGFNLVTANAYARWFARPISAAAAEVRPPVSFYVGLGAGAAVPHVQASLGGATTSEYQLAGPALRGMVGVDAPFDAHLSWLLEGTLTWTEVTTDVAGGGRLRATFLVPALAVGIGLRE